MFEWRSENWSYLLYLYQFNLATGKISEFVIFYPLATGKIGEFWSARKVDFSVYFMGHLGKTIFQNIPVFTSNKPLKNVPALKFIVSEAFSTSRNIADTHLDLKISMLKPLNTG